MKGKEKIAHWILRVSGILLVVGFLCVFSPAFAQEENTPVSPVAPPAVNAESEENGVLPQTSLLFTYWEHQALLDAKSTRGAVRTRSQEDPGAAQTPGSSKETPEPAPPPQPTITDREIALGGIAYTSAKEWTIWLNGHRITPKAIPHEIRDIKVYKEYIELKWFDEITNRIFPIRLRPHQRFSLDSKVFLPG
ncbi:MAG: hypothetical protein K9G62_04075 [Alphaproteobacteria bacterium]|nr:hypothetical protein [Alphaproteobacteria bacterium]